jgi:hypothetical protein
MAEFAVDPVVALGQKYWNMWSFLGLFLSMTSQAPISATKRDFFARLTAMYGWWCRELTGFGANSLFTICQCTWRGSSGARADFFLGHSFEGAKGSKHWKDTVRRESWHLIERTLGQTFRTFWSYDTSPLRSDDGRAGTRFGNCGETYPFITILTYVLHKPICVLVP